MKRRVFGMCCGIGLGVLLGACANGGVEDGGALFAVGNDAELAEVIAAGSPLQDVMSQVSGFGFTLEEQQRALDERSLRNQELLAQCMLEQGFQYLPIPHAGGILVGASELFQPDDPEWVARFGYGIVVNPLDVITPSEPELPPTLQDPNADYLRSLTEPERAAFSQSLDNCQVWARETFDAENVSLWQTDEFSPLLNAIQEFQITLQNRPEFAALNREWANCLAETGHGGFGRETEAQDSIRLKLEYLWTTPEWEQGDRSPNNNQAVADLADQEVELALADLNCAGTLNLRQRELATQYQLEARVINENRSAFNALLDAAAQGR